MIFLCRLKAESQRIFAIRLFNSAVLINFKSSCGGSDSLHDLSLEYALNWDMNMTLATEDVIT